MNLPKLICKDCGTVFLNQNAKTKLCSDCNPNSAKQKAAREEEWRERLNARIQNYDGNKRKTFMPE